MNLHRVPVERIMSVKRLPQTGQYELDCDFSDTQHWRWYTITPPAFPGTKWRGWKMGVNLPTDGVLLPQAFTEQLVVFAHLEVS